MASDISLMERNYGGVFVSILWHPTSGNLALIVKEGEFEPFLAPIGKDEALDAYAHPYCYLSRADIEISRSRKRELVLA